MRPMRWPDERTNRGISSISTNPTPLREPLGLKIYRAVSRAGEPIASLALQRRLKAGKEDPVRITDVAQRLIRHSGRSVVFWL